MAFNIIHSANDWIYVSINFNWAQVCFGAWATARSKVLKVAPTEMMPKLIFSENCFRRRSIPAAFIPHNLLNTNNLHWATNNKPNWRKTQRIKMSGTCEARDSAQQPHWISLCFFFFVCWKPDREICRWKVKTIHFKKRQTRTEIYRGRWAAHNAIVDDFRFSFRYCFSSSFNSNNPAERCKYIRGDATRQHRYSSK